MFFESSLSVLQAHKEMEREFLINFTLLVLNIKVVEYFLILLYLGNRIPCVIIGKDRCQATGYRKEGNLLIINTCKSYDIYFEYEKYNSTVDNTEHDRTSDIN